LRSRWSLLLRQGLAAPAVVRALATCRHRSLQAACPMLLRQPPRGAKHPSALSLSRRLLCTELPELTTTPSGLMYRDVFVPDDTATATRGQHVAVHYAGRLEDGTVFDSSHDRGKPIDFELGARQVIRGWEEGIAGMRVGGRRQLVIPPQLGYGARGAPPAIPPNALLHFDVELVSASVPGGWFGRLTTILKALPFK